MEQMENANVDYSNIDISFKKKNLKNDKLVGIISLGCD